jgi:catechol 2,3-dioxygenase-like lactoylglutathione lyase family enzyme
MNIIPVLKCQRIEESLKFYTQVLDFEALDAEDLEFPYRLLIREGARLDISLDDGGVGAVVYIAVDNVDGLFQKFLERGLDISDKTGVHSQPTDQTWGMREFYVEDPDQNTIRFGQIIQDK